MTGPLPLNQRTPHRKEGARGGTRGSPAKASASAAVSGSTTRADVAENEDDARKALEEAMSQLKSNGIGIVGPSLVVTKDDLEFIKLEQKQAQDQPR